MGLFQCQVAFLQVFDVIKEDERGHTCVICLKEVLCYTKAELKENGEKSFGGYEYLPQLRYGCKTVFGQFY